MRVVFYTSGTTGSGRLVRGISIGNAIRRKDPSWQYVIISFSPFAHLADIFGIKHIELPPEDESQLSPDSYSGSHLYKTILSLNPDVLIIDLLWFPLYHFIRDIRCKKIFICHYVVDSFFAVPLKEHTLYFRPEDYDRMLAIEPFRNKFPFDEINPIIIRNRSEILSRKSAMDALGLADNGRKKCLVAFNARPGDFDTHKKKYSHLEREGYDMVYSTNYEKGIFPAVDYFNAFDLIVCGAGYNQFWEAKYFDKRTVLETIQGHFSSQEKRIKMGRNFHFDENGADQLVDIIQKI
jgi:hypothetical protein